MATKNLGQISAIHIGTVEPQNKNLVWRDISQNPNLWKIWNSVDLVWEVVPSQTVANNFLNLGDTPVTYAGSGGKILKIKANLSGIEFVDEVTFLSEISAAIAKGTLVDADEFLLSDAGVVKKTLWSDIKATLKTYFDTLYVSVSTVTSQLIANWNTAFGWGNHADAGYLTSESDPVFTAHPASNVVNNGSGNNYLSDDGTYKAITIPDGSKWEDESETLIRPKDGKKVDASHIEGLEQGGHTILDPAGNTMPTQDALQFGLGFTVTDEVGKTVVGRVITYSIDFLTTIIVAQDINMFGAAVIDNIIASNVASILLTYSGGLQQAITPGENTIAITAGDILTWEITRTNAGQLAALGIHLSLNE